MANPHSTSPVVMVLRPVEILASDSPSVDAFGRWRVSSPYLLSETQNEYNESPLFWETVLTGGGTATHLPNESSVRLRVAANGDKVVRQLRQYQRYQPGRSLGMALTVVLGAATANIRRRAGYFDPSNGIFLEQTGSGLSFVRRTFASGAAVDNSVAQASWNKDPLDGTGPSGITLDPSKGQIFLIDLQWLGMGRVRLGFDIDGRVVEAHEFKNANVLSTVYMTTANLPVRYELEATGAIGGNTDLIQTCSEVVSEGGFETERGVPVAAAMTAVKAGIGTTRTPLVSIRPKATFGTKVVRGQVLHESFDGLVGSGSALFEVIYNGALTAAAFATAGASSITEFDTAATAITGGILVGAVYGSGGAVGARGRSERDIISRLPLALDIAGANPINLTLCGRALTGTVDLAGALNWRELY